MEVHFDGHHVPLQKMVRVLRIGQLKKTLLFADFLNLDALKSIPCIRIYPEASRLHDRQQEGMLPFHEDLLLLPLLGGKKF